MFCENLIRMSNFVILALYEFVKHKASVNSTILKYARRSIGRHHRTFQWLLIFIRLPLQTALIIIVVLLYFIGVSFRLHRIC